MSADVIDLHEYFTECQQCGGFLWYIQWTQDCQDVLQIVCGNPDCGCVVENPMEPEIAFEADFDLDVEVT